MDLDVSTNGRVEFVDVTDEVASAVPEDVRHGTCTLFVPHTTAGVVVNENESGLLADLRETLERLAPAGEPYEHGGVDGNADAHLRATLVGPSVTIPVVDGELALGTWQSVLFAEFDGPRERRLTVGVQGDS